MLINMYTFFVSMYSLKWKKHLNCFELVVLSLLYFISFKKIISILLYVIKISRKLRYSEKKINS